MKFFKLIEKDKKVKDILGYESKDIKEGLLLHPSPISLIHNDYKYNIAEVKPIGKIVPNGELSNLYYADCVVITNIFNTNDIIDLYDNPEWIYLFIISTFNSKLKDKAFDKLLYNDKDYKYLIKYVKYYGKNKCKILTRLLVEDTKGDLLYKFGLICKEFAPIIQESLINLKNLRLLNEYTKHNDDISTWKTQTTLLSNNAPSDILIDFAINNISREIDLEAIKDKIEELGGDVNSFMNKFNEKIEKLKIKPWWHVE